MVTKQAEQLMLYFQLHYIRKIYIEGEENLIFHPHVSATGGRNS
jgi:hypothetical protein